MKTETVGQDYHNKIQAMISPKEAFEGICKVSAWWARDFKGSSQTEGDEFRVRFGDTFVDFKITKCIPFKKIVWMVQDCQIPWLKDKKEWKDTKIVWEISSKDNSTEIEMTHVGLVPVLECFDDCNEGWNHFVKKSLFKLLTEGVGVLDK